MKKIIIYLFLVISAAIGLWPYNKPFSLLHEKLLYKSVCDTPITYKIGTVDKRFNLPEEEFLQITCRQK